MVEDSPLEDVMVDIETLGTGDHAPILQIAAVRFDAFRGTGFISTPEGSFNWHVDPRTKNFGVADGDTISWWMSQPDEVRQRVFNPAEGWHGGLKDGLQSFVIWLADQGSYKRIWASGPQFDLRLLRQACERNEVPWPIPYGVERDFRTLKDIGRRLGVSEPERVGVHHDARDDAFHQAGYAIAILRRINHEAQTTM